MDEFNSRLLTALVLGLAVDVMAASAKLLAGLHVLAILLPILASLGGWWLLYSWRQMQGMADSAPILQYAMLILSSFVLFGWLFSFNGQPQALAGVVSLALLAPALGEWVRDQGKFKKEAPERSDDEPYRPSMPQFGGLGIQP